MRCSDDIGNPLDFGVTNISGCSYCRMGVGGTASLAWARIWDMSDTPHGTGREGKGISSSRGCGNSLVSLSIF